MSRRAAGAIRALGVVIALAALLGACNSVRDKGRVELLDFTVRTYEKMMRWGEYREAAKYVRPRPAGDDAAPAAEPVDYEALEPIRVTGMRTIRRVVTSDQDEAAILVTIEFYHNDYGVVKTMDYLQTWYHDEDSKSWYLANDLPDFLAELRGERP